MARNFGKDTTPAAVPATVKVIRLRRGYTAAQLAASIGKSPGWVSRLENGQVQAKGWEVDDLAAVLDVPAPLLGIDLPAPMAEGEAFALHRTPKRLVAQLEAEAAVRVHIIDAILDAARQPKTPNFQQYSVEHPFEIEALARQVRTQWGVAEGQPVVPLAGYLERDGIVMSYLPLDLDPIQALAFWYTTGSTPLIMLSRTISHNEQRFALARQYAHLILDRRSPAAKGGPWGTEERATVFARELLAPTAHIRHQVADLKTGDIEGLLRLCQYWGMPASAIISQGVEGRYISQHQARVWKKRIACPSLPLAQAGVDAYPVEFTAMRDVLNYLREYEWNLASLLHITKVNAHDLKATVGVDSTIFSGAAGVGVLRAL